MGNSVQKELKNSVEEKKRSDFTLISFSQVRNTNLVDERYELIEKLGEGAFGRVYKVNDKKDMINPVKALKLVPVQSDEQFMLFQREINLLAQQQHKNIVKYYRSFILRYDPESPHTTRGKLFAAIIMECCEGVNLDQLIKLYKLKREKIPMYIIIPFFLDLLDALKHIHSKGICHRDLKPENILVVCDLAGLVNEKQEAFLNTSVKISDFGVGAVSKNGIISKNDKAGTILYLAPEMFDNEDYDLKVDIYSLGIIFSQVASCMSTEDYTHLFAAMAQAIAQHLPEQLLNIASKEMLVGLVQQSNLFRQVLISRSDDFAITTMLSYMLCDKSERKSAVEIQNSCIVRTWNWVLNRCSDNSFDKSPEAVIGLISGIKYSLSKSTVLRSLFKVFTIINDTSQSSLTPEEIIASTLFMKCNGTEVLLTYTYDMLKQSSKHDVSFENERIWEVTLAIISCLYRHSNLLGGYRLCFQLNQKIRKLDIENFLSLGMKTESVVNYYRVLANLCKYSQTIREKIYSPELALRLVGRTLKVEEGDEAKQSVVMNLLFQLVPSMSADLAEKLFQVLKLETICVLMCTIDPAKRGMLAGRIFSRIADLVQNSVDQLKTVNLKLLEIMVSLSTCYLVDYHKKLAIVSTYSKCTQQLLDSYSLPNQWFLKCNTCFKDDATRGVCLTCGIKCHEGHDLELDFAENGFFCDCHEINSGDHCQCQNEDWEMVQAIEEIASCPPQDVTFQIEQLETAEHITDLAKSRYIGTRTNTAVTVFSKHSIRSAASSSTSPQNCTYYLELLIRNGGPYDEITIGVSNTNDHKYLNTEIGEFPNSVSYCCSSGAIKLCMGDDETKKSFAAMGPSSTGTYVGVGVTCDGRVFFTRDSHVLPFIPNVKFSNNESVYLGVTLRGKGTAVHLLHNQSSTPMCLQSKELTNCSSSDSFFHQSAVDTIASTNLRMNLQKLSTCTVLTKPCRDKISLLMKEIDKTK